MWSDVFGSFACGTIAKASSKQGSSIYKFFSFSLNVDKRTASKTHEVNKVLLPATLMLCWLNLQICGGAYIRVAGDN
jgi:hypothetical protein